MENVTNKKTVEVMYNLKDEKVTLETSVENLDLSKRAVGVLKGSNINTLNDLFNLTFKDYLMLKFRGENICVEVTQAAYKYRKLIK